jgi:tRNA pseudouridine38-40 synthase
MVVVVEYDGTNYCGFQKQLHEPTIQAQLESALSQVTQEECKVVAAGRTDTGVHARGQVVHFQTKWRHSQAELLRAMNALLPGDVAGQRIFSVAADFHARNSAQSRFYRYVVFNGEVRSPFAERFAHRVSAALNVRDMNRASEYLVGVHDFGSFGQSPCDGHTVREVYGAYWWRQGDWVFFDIEANAFLRRMVRSLVGTLLLVGRGAMLAEEINRILGAMDRNLAGPTAPPQGLCLERVCYREPWQDIV